MNLERLGGDGCVLWLSVALHVISQVCLEGSFFWVIFASIPSFTDPSQQSAS
jgi:hypothetical protein